MKIKLYDIAHSRAGDKGNISTLSLIPYKEEDYPLLVEKVSAQVVKKHLQTIVLGDITLYEMPPLHALHFLYASRLNGWRYYGTYDGYTR